MTMTNDQKFIQALEVISEIAPYMHLKDAIQKARDLAPMLKDDGYKHDEPSEKTLSELRDKLTADDDNRPRTPHYAPVGFDLDDLPVGNDDSPADDIPNRF